MASRRQRGPTPLEREIRRKRARAIREWASDPTKKATQPKRDYRDVRQMNKANRARRSGL